MFQPILGFTGKVRAWTVLRLHHASGGDAIELLLDRRGGIPEGTKLQPVSV